MFYITYLERTSKSKKLIVYKERINIFNMKKNKNCLDDNDRHWLEIKITGTPLLWTPLNRLIGGTHVHLPL